MLLKNNISEGKSSVMDDRYAESDENKKILYIDANNLNCWAMSESPPYDEIKIDRNVKLEDILKTADDSDLS